MPELNPNRPIPGDAELAVIQGLLIKNLQNLVNALEIGSLKIRYAAGPGSDIGFNIPANFSGVELVLPNPLPVDISKLATVNLDYCTAEGTGNANFLVVPPG